MHDHEIHLTALDRLGMAEHELKIAQDNYAEALEVFLAEEEEADLHNNIEDVKAEAEADNLADELAYARQLEDEYRS